MTAARQIPNAAKARQLAAADPERSVFVSANAGSGKTHVLVQRVINLLLRGADPAKILCVTYTKAAAANMATRVFDVPHEARDRATEAERSETALRDIADKLERILVELQSQRRGTSQHG